MTRRYAGRFIVKVQRPVLTSGPVDVVLVYSRNKTRVHTMLPMPHKFVRQIFGDGHKQFCYAYLRGRTIHLDGIAPWQDW